MVYSTLFFASLLAATLLPGGSEALLLYDLSNTDNIIWLLFICATVGNTLGSVINYIIGLKGVDYLTQKGYAKQKYLNSADQLFDKYGAWALLLSWVPVVGDPITFVAGALKYSFKWFVVLVLFAKGLRYMVVIGLYLGM